MLQVFDISVSFVKGANSRTTPALSCNWYLIPLAVAIMVWNTWWPSQCRYSNIIRTVMHNKCPLLLLGLTGYVHLSGPLSLQNAANWRNEMRHLSQRGELAFVFLKYIRAVLNDTLGRWSGAGWAALFYSRGVTISWMAICSLVGVFLQRIVKLCHRGDEKFLSSIHLFIRENI